MEFWLPAEGSALPLHAVISSFSPTDALSLLFFFLFFFSAENCGLFWSVQTSCSQHRLATFTLLVLKQPGLGSRSSREQRGTHPTAPSMQVHWCLQFGRKISPFWWILLLYSQDLPSDLADKAKAGSRTVNRAVTTIFVFSFYNRWDVPLQMPIADSFLPPKLHSKPFVWSHGCVSLQSSNSCRGQTPQQPQLTSTFVHSPLVQVKSPQRHGQCLGHEADTWGLAKNIKHFHLEVRESALVIWH